MRERERYYSEPLSNENANIKGMAAVVRLIRAHPSIKRVALITRQLNSTQFLEAFYNSADAPKIIAKGNAPFPTTSTNTIYSSMGKHSSIENEVVVTLGLTSDDLLYFEDRIESKFIIAIPWIEGEVEKWSRITEALESQTLVPATRYDEPECILKQALDDMSSINKGSVPFHDSDHERVKTYFKALHENSIEMNENIVEAYLFRERNWSKRAIDHALTILSAIKEGRKTKGKIGDTNYFLNKWRNACA